LIKDICGCIPITQAIAPTRQPAMQQPYVPPTQVNGCSVCGDGKNISFPDVLFSYPGQPSVLCSQLENDGYTGLIPQEYCAFLPGLITGVCGCDDVSAPFPPPKDDDSIGTNGGDNESVRNDDMNGGDNEAAPNDDMNGEGEELQPNDDVEGESEELQPNDDVEGEDEVELEPATDDSIPDDDFGDPDFFGDENMNNRFTLSPTEPSQTQSTMEYIPPLDSSDSEDEIEITSVNWNQNEFETLEKMAHDKNVIIVLSIVFGLMLLFSIFVAHQMLNNPDGCCASVCRILTRCTCCIMGALCFPCKMICGSKDYAHSRMIDDHSTFASHDLDLT